MSRIVGGIHMGSKVSSFFYVAVIMLFSSLLLTGCSDYEKLDGVWDRGDIVVTFSNGSATFTQINSNSNWEKVRQNGSVRVGDKKFRYVSGSYPKWTAEELTYDYSTYLVKGWEDCTITMDGDGQTITVYTPGASPTTTIYTKD